MFTLNCDYYRRSFQHLHQLLNDILESGMDPNYEVVFNGENTGVMAIDLITP